VLLAILVKWRIYVRFKKAPIQKALVNLKIAPNSKVRLAHYSKVKFKKFKNGALVAIFKIVCSG
jgi:hypothetical protein